MARLFDDAATQYINIGSAILTGVPITMACWFNVDEVGINQVLFSIADTATNSHHHHMRVSSGDVLAVASADVIQGGDAITSTGITVNTWYHGCGVWTASDDRAAFIDGGSKGTNATSVTPAGLDNTAIGALVRIGVIQLMSGRIAEAAIWNIALTDAEVAILAKGYSPLLVRPQNLVFYAPLVREIQDVVGGVALTNNGTTVGDHTRVLYPTPSQVGVAPVPGIVEINVTPASVSLLALAPGTGLGIDPAVVRVLGIAPVVGVVVGPSVVRFIAVVPTVDVGGIVVSPAVLSFRAVAPRGLTWVDYGVIEREIDEADYGGEQFFLEVMLQTNDVNAPAHARIFNITDNVPVLGSDIQAVSTVPIRVRSGALILSGEKEYKVQLGIEA